ncbi:hypothetical protein Tco_0731288, partial [Tanacetum coccineum]
MTDTETSSFESPLKVDKDWKKKFFYPAIRVESVNQIEKPFKRTVRYADKSLVKEQESRVKSSFVEGCGSNTNKNVSEVEPKKVRKNNDALIIEDWVSDDEEQDESKTKLEKKTVIPTAAKIEKPVKKSARYAEMYRSQCPRGNQRNWNEKGVSGNNYNRVDNDYYAKTSHHRTHKNMTPRAVLLRTGLKPLSTAKHFNHKVNTVRPKVVNRTSVNAARANRFNAGKPQLDDKGFV